MQPVVKETGTFTTVDDSLSRIPVGVSISHISHTPFRHIMCCPIAFSDQLVDLHLGIIVLAYTVMHGHNTYLQGNNVCYNYYGQCYNSVYKNP